MKIVIFHFKLNNLLNWIKMTHFELNNILNWITTIIQNWIIFWIEFSWNDFEWNIKLNQFWAKFQYWIESIWVSDRARVFGSRNWVDMKNIGFTWQLWRKSERFIAWLQKFAGQPCLSHVLENMWHRNCILIKLIFDLNN